MTVPVEGGAPRDAPAVRSEYARLECERRFVLTRVPPDAHSAVEITDGYLDGTGLRLRTTRARDGAVARKLAHKVRPVADDPTVVEHTSLHLSEAEHTVLATLPATELRKTRFHLDRGDLRWAVDLFHGPLEGLVLAEASFREEDAMRGLVAPDWVGQEVSRDERYSGGALARTAVEEAPGLLPPDAGPKLDWSAWHDPYDDPGSPLSRRLEAVRAAVREALDRSPPGPVRVVSLCAGRGLDVLPVVALHPRRDDVVARLVELDAANAAAAVAIVEEEALERIEVVEGDAAEMAAYEGVLPAEVVLVCGIFGNVVDDDVRHTVMSLPMFCARGATVLWTRHRGEPDITPRIRGWFAEAGFEEVSFESPAGVLGVGAHRWPAEAAPFEAGRRLFTFVR